LIYHRDKNKKNHLVSIHLEPKLPNVSPLKIEINPSHFDSHEGLRMFLGQFCLIDDLKITRVDHSVDVYTHSVTDFHSALVCSRKKSRELYKSGVELTTFYLGNRPERVIVYNKALKDGASDQLKTRVEVQQYRDKVPITSFVKLVNYQSINPFEILNFKEIPDIEPEALADRKKLLRLKYEINMRGAQASYKYLNSHSNFKRDFGHLFRSAEHFPDLQEIYKSNLKKYFMPQGGVGGSGGISESV
jgi:DNA relaxase NicK